jgi:hypothetical protein
MQVDSLAPTSRLEVPPKTDARSLRGTQLAGIVFLSLILCSVANHCLAYWLGLPRSAPWTQSAGNYRRIGPNSGPQVFCAGSSLLVSGLSWPEVAESFGLGIENWTVAGSSPEVWEVFQQQKRNSDTTIIGLSVYDLNEIRLTPDRAKYVPLTQTISDLRASNADPSLSRRILTQYAMTYVRYLFPMAGEADKVLVELRRKIAERLGLQASLDEHEGVILERNGVLEVGESTMNLRDWSSARMLRRVAALRADNYGSHQFSNGPKNLAFRRVLSRAQQQGRVIVVVLPVSDAYAEAFLDPTVVGAFEKALNDAMARAPEAILVRLDRVPGISDGKYFFDLVHLNTPGQRVATPVFLKEVTQATSKRNTPASSAPLVKPAGQQ